MNCKVNKKCRLIAQTSIFLFIFALMEKLMQYIWANRLYLSEDMVTNDGLKVRVIDPGRLNTDAGPDFFNAKVEIDGEMWAGNVEIHVRASDWRRHNHHMDRAYDSVILHVVEKDDAPVYRTDGMRIPQLVLKPNPHFNDSYRQLVNSTIELPCADRIGQIPKLFITEWMESLAFERLQSKADRMLELYDAFNGSWEDVCYVALARNLGFGINNDAFERLARRAPLHLMQKHSDSLLQIEAFLFGQVGMLYPDAFPDDAYFQQLCSEYAFLANKFQLSPLESHGWKMFRIRPQNFPHRRIAMLARFVYGGFKLMSRIIDAPDEKALREIFSITLSGYWANHYSFGKPSEIESRALGNRSIDILLINTVAPLFYARSEVLRDSRLADKAVALLQDLKPENCSIVSQFTFAGIKCPDALTSQALIQLRREYCEKRKCLYCRIGHRLLSVAAQQR